MPSARITVTLPAEVVDAIDRLEKNRSRFVLEGVRRELVWRRREAFRESLANAHAESVELAEEGLTVWSEGHPGDEGSGLVNSDAGTPIRWTRDRGWTVAEE
jgi:hypothetical protein